MISLRKKILVKRHLRRNGYLFSPVLRDEELFDLLVTDTMFDSVATISDTTVQGLQDFFQWLVDNQDAIFALIARIISLFA